jgi:hypothetical protein
MVLAKALYRRQHLIHLSSCRANQSLQRDRFFHQPRSEQDRGQPSACMGAGPHKVEVPVAGVAVLRSQVTHLGEIVAQPKSGPVSQVEYVLSYSSRKGPW